MGRQPKTKQIEPMDYHCIWHGFDICGWRGRIGWSPAYFCEVTLGSTLQFDFKGRHLGAEDSQPGAGEAGEFLGHQAKPLALARVRAIIDLRSFALGETIERRLLALKTSGMPRNELRRRLLGVFYTLSQELPRTYESEAIDVDGLRMELEVSENECISALNYLIGRGWLEEQPLRTGLVQACITADGIVEYELRGQPPSTGEVFVCWREDDTGKQQLQQLEYKLRACLGQDRIFKATENTGAGFWREKIKSAIQVCKVMLVLIGPRWLSIEGDDGRRRLDDPQDIVRLEIETAFAEGKTVIPVLFEGVEMPADEELPDSPLRRLQECQRHPIDPDRWNADTDKLIKALKVELGRPPAGGI